MSLVKYKKKRSFVQTPEPQGGRAGAAKLQFVVQKHAASRLHYDFRLEMEGVLKSWAVPKGPSMDPSVKRLAMMVEDHPFDYKSFEGTIPEGNYGAGTVIVWDEGTYEPVENNKGTKAVIDKEVRHQLHKGKIKFTLHGKKLKGEFALVKASGRGDNSWLLMKLKDRHASADDILLKEKSVVSNKTIEQLSKTEKPKAEKRALRKPVKRKENSSKKKSSVKTPAAIKKQTNNKEVTALLTNAPEATFPASMKPMLATLVDKAFDKSGWLYEAKWDGYRALAFINKDSSRLMSRNEKSFNDKFYPVYQEISKLPLQAVIDGEIVVLNDRGLSDFGSLQNWRSEADGRLIFYVFDVLWLDGKDLTRMPLSDRRTILRAILPDSDIIRLSETFETSGLEFYDLAKQMGLEGIIAKKADSLYYPDARSKEWLKIKANRRQEVVIGGFTRNKDSSKVFSSLLVGVYEKDELVYTGKIGTGFTDKQQEEMMQKFKPLITKKNPFSSSPDINKPSRFRPNPPNAVATWLKPKLICEVSFAEMTSDGVMRHPSFEGIRVDKKAHDVLREKATPTKKVLEQQKETPNQELLTKIIRKPGKQSRNTLLNPKEETQVRDIDGHSLKFTNLSKIYWPKEKITKRDMLNYYYQVAPFILPYLKDRPQSLNRFPNGINGKSFYQKDVTGKVPSWVKKYLYHSSDEERDKHFMVGSDEASVLYMASLGCIELNPWSSTIHKPDHPDWCIIDLDPDKNSFDQVIEAAQVTKEVLDNLKVPCYCKTSGSTGLHIYIPLGAKYTYEQSKEFARAIVTSVHEKIPKYTTIERKVSDRKGKMYLDFLQNRPQATLAAPYSLRPKPGAPVSMPLEWSEVKRGLKMTDFNIFNAVDRLQQKGDLFKPVLGKGIDLQKVIRNF